MGSSRDQYKENQGGKNRRKKRQKRKQRKGRRKGRRNRGKGKS